MRIPLTVSVIALAIASTAVPALSQERTCGMIGCSGDETGAFVNVARSGGAAQVTFQVGMPDSVPFARVPLTLAPQASRPAGKLGVTFNSRVEQLAEKSPGGLGAITWGIQLQDEESNIVRSVDLDAGGVLVKPSRSDGSGAEFVVPPQARAPYRLVFHLGFFKASRDLRFLVTGDGPATPEIPSDSRAEGPTPPKDHDTDGTAGDSASAKGGQLESSAPQKADPDSLADSPTVTATQPPTAFVPPDVVDKPGTWLTLAEIKDRPQDLSGLWVEVDDSKFSMQLERFDNQGQDLVVHPLDDRESVAIRVRRVAGTSRWGGTGAAPGIDGTGMYTCPRPDGTCPQLCRFSAGFLDIVPGSLQIRGEWNSKKDDPTKCVFTEEPDSGQVTFNRFVGVSFVPLKPGKYMYLGMAPAVGGQPAQFKAVVHLATNYQGTSAAQVRAAVKPGQATISRTSGDTLTGAYEFSTRASGRLEVTFEPVGIDGTVFHTDRVRIDIPSIPGIGN